MSEAGKNSILVVDDEKSNILVLMDILKPEYNVFATTQGHAAIEIAEKHLPDIILLDIVMPDMDGYELLAALKNSEKTKDIPVIFVTGLSSALDEEKGLALGISDYITKPFSPAIVKLRVRNQIQQMQSTKIAKLANRSKSEFLATMSHEIRTPMNNITGFAELALTSDSIVQMKDYLRKISDSTKWLLRILNNILDISKIESGKMELERVPFNLNEVILHCQSVISPGVKEKGLDLKVCIEPLIEKRLLGDPIRLYQVLMNLLSNAVKFTNTGTIKLLSSLKSLNDNIATVYFEIKDSGIGMSLKQTEKIFDPFTQAESSTTRNYGGTGLGLSITKNIVELMGGKLEVESSQGSGSTFSFEIEFDTTEVSVESNGSVNFDLLEKPQFDGLVLICDDNPLNQQVICINLEQVGLKTVVAENGKIGVEIVEERKQKGEKPFDLIFMDMSMPVMDGIEAASKILALDAKTPIVAMTANIMASDIENYRNHGMYDYIGKPFTAQELWRVLLKYLTPSNNSINDSGRVVSRADNGRDNVTAHPYMSPGHAKLVFTQ